MRASAIKICYIIAVLALPVLLLESCSSSTSNFNRQYNKLWKEMVKSQAWKASLESDGNMATMDDSNFYASNSEPSIIESDQPDRFNTEAVFIDKYNSLVSQAYYKLILEAEIADSRLKNEYETLNSEHLAVGAVHTRAQKNNLSLTNKRYLAHREMLEGLKSWNAFSEYGSDDLKFFKEEHRHASYTMYRQGQDDERIISFLVYKLADLYHFEE